MDSLKAIFSKLRGLKSWFLKASLKKKLVILVAILAVGWFGGSRIIRTREQQPQYQTVHAEKGTLITSVSASGTVTSESNVGITTNATGIVKEVYVKDGDTVSQGDKIADITLDINSQQKQAAAWSSYLSAKNSLDSAKAKINSLQAAEFKANQTFMNDAVARGLATDDQTYIQENALWLQVEADYKNQSAVITQSQAAVNSAWLSYIQLSSTITAPASGRISGLTLTPGIPITSTSSTSSNSSNGSSTSGSSSVLGTITIAQGQLQVSVNLTEIDVTKVTTSQKVTLTLDAFPGKTFSGKVLTVNTNGSVSSGVTAYPATISFDSALSNIYPNMAVNAKIITNVKNNVILVPSGAVQSTSGESTVRIMRNGQITQVPVEIGDLNDTQTEIISGITEGDTVVTGSTATNVTRTGGQGTTSPFGSFGGTRGGAGGGGVFIRR